MTYDTEVSRDQLGQIYKTASLRMTKKALDWDSLKDSFKNLNISDDFFTFKESDYPNVLINDMR